MPISPPAGRHRCDAGRAHCRSVLSPRSNLQGCKPDCATRILRPGGRQARDAECGCRRISPSSKRSPSSSVEFGLPPPPTRLAFFHGDLGGAIGGVGSLLSCKHRRERGSDQARGREGIVGGGVRQPIAPAVRAHRALPSYRMLQEFLGHCGPPREFPTDTFPAPPASSPHEIFAAPRNAGNGGDEREHGPRLTDRGSGGGVDSSLRSTSRGLESAPQFQVVANEDEFSKCRASPTECLRFTGDPLRCVVSRGICGASAPTIVAADMPPTADMSLLQEKGARRFLQKKARRNS
jgi:hypothetical protein